MDDLLLFYPRSTQNVRIERLWRDVRKDTLEVFRQTFMQLKRSGLLDMENIVHRLALFVVYQPRIQASLERTIRAWNHHKIRTEGNNTPVAIWELSRTTAMQRGYWTGDPGDDVTTATAAEYGVDPGAPSVPPEEARADPLPGIRIDDFTLDPDAMKHAGLMINEDEEVELARQILAGLDVEREDGNWGMSIYQEAVAVMMAAFHDVAGAV
jgi:hypothetical protein